MELNSDIVTSRPRDAATVVILRDGPTGLEVFLVKRHGLSDVLGGAYVFPGGKLDPADAQLLQLLDSAPPDLQAQLGEPELVPAQAAALFVAAMREAYEECGVLFAQARPAKRASGDAAPGAFGEMLQQQSLQLLASALVPWVRWITPIMPSVSSKRFDTRFFVAAMPQAQSARHDDHETTHSQWLSPRAALAQYRSAAIELAPPQIMSLAHLARHQTVAQVLDEARRQAPPVVLPEAFDEHGERVICYPGDPRHSVSRRALPGPTRLVYRDQRFAPPAGFDSLFD